MTRGTRTQAAIAAGLLCFSPLLARADAAADARLAAMEQRMTQLEDKLAVSEQKVAEQAEVLKTQATPAVGAGEVVEEIDVFLSRVDVAGYVSASYVYNANNPDDPTYAQALNQFNLDHNTFNLDAADIELSMPASEPGQGGFQLDINFGQNAQILGGYFNDDDELFAADNVVEIEQMNVQYNWEGILFKAGKFDTLLGYEVIDIVANKQVTQGVLFTYAIPLYHTGLLASGKLGETFGWAAGVTNGWNNANDLNDNKGVLAQLNLSTGPFSHRVHELLRLGREHRLRESRQRHAGLQHLARARARLDRDGQGDRRDHRSGGRRTGAPRRTWSSSMTGDWTRSVRGPHPERAAGTAALLGASFQLTEALWLSARGEVMRDSKGYRIADGDEVTAYTLTGTLGYQLTPNLLGRLEVRYDDLHADDTVIGGGVLPAGQRGQRKRPRPAVHRQHRVRLRLIGGRGSVAQGLGRTARTLRKQPFWGARGSAVARILVWYKAC